MNYGHGRSFLRDALVATVAVVALYGLGQGVQFQPVQIPGYLLIVGFDFLEVTFGSAGANYDVLFAAYLLALGIGGAGVAYALREARGAFDVAGWRFGAAGALVVVGFVSLLFALRILLGAGPITPFLISGATALVLLGLAAWLVGLLDTATAE